MKEGLLDPQGKAVQDALPTMGWSNVTDVRVGRRVELSIDATDEGLARTTVERLATELFANPLIEAWAIEGPIA